MNGFVMPEGLGGYCISRTERIAYLPVVINPNQGNGAVGRLLDHLKATHDVVIVTTVTSPRLQGMLDRRGFVTEYHWVPEFGDYAEVALWRRPYEHDGTEALDRADPIPDQEAAACSPDTSASSPRSTGP